MGTRTPLQPTEQCELFHTVGCRVYLIRYPQGQEDRARECAYRWVRNPELAFTWNDAADMCEGLPDPPLSCEPGCECDACIADLVRAQGVPYVDKPPTLAEYASAVVWMGAIAAPWVVGVIVCRVAWAKAVAWGWV